MISLDNPIVLCYIASGIGVFSTLLWQNASLEKLPNSYQLRISLLMQGSPYTHSSLLVSCELTPTVAELRAKQNGATTLPASELSAEANNNPGTLHGTRPPIWEIASEQPWHRIAAYLFATGCTSCKQVAEIIGDIDQKTVQNLLRNKWFQERVTKLLAENGGKDIMALLRAEQFNSLVVLVEIRDDPKQPPAVRSGICKDILDRTLGKPVQRIETSESPTSDDPVAEANRLKQELARS